MVVVDALSVAGGLWNAGQTTETLLLVQSQLEKSCCFGSQTKQVQMCMINGKHPSSWTCNSVVSNFTKTNLNVILNFSCSLTILPKVRVLIHISLQVLPTFCAG
jgi:hypothetical protein